MDRKQANDIEKLQDENAVSTQGGDTGSQNDFIYQIFRHSYKLVSFVGFEVLRVIKQVYDAENRLSKVLKGKLEPSLQKLCIKIRNGFSSFGKSFARPFTTISHGFALVCDSAKTAKKENRSVRKAVFSTVCRGAKRNGWFFKGLLNYSAAALGLAVVITAVVYMSNMDIAVAVEYKGQQLGYIENEAVYEEASKMLQERIVYEEGDVALDTQPKLTLKMISNTDQVVSESGLVDNMIKMSGSDIVESNGIYIGGKFYGAVKTVSEIEATVEKILAKYKTNNPNETVELVNPVEIKEGIYLTSSVKEEQEIVDLLNSEVAGEVTYTVEAGDTPSGVAKKNGVSYSDFKAMNPDCESKFLIGQKVYIAKSEPFAAVKVIRKETYKVETMFETETIKDNSKSISYSKVTQNGVKGVTEVTADMEYVNGVKVKETVLSTKVLQQVVNQKIVKGTKMPTAAKVTASSGGSSLSGLKFIWPVAGGYISSPFGGARRHGGIDIAAPHGTAIYAAESGTVSLARWNGSYGNCVVIDHGNGIQTLYGHSSKLLVKVGQQVKKGDVIALVGSTGRSTGNHCHFEIHKGGSRINPAPYIG
ncbi:MAG: peptidoglycan DD-metalloendopeptidase family protein [Clostridiales bacterium]|nr:peptidoglycan DD-metalloendopeptidase family protein [Clostridiales bacterium]